MPVNLLNEGDLNKYLTNIVFADGEVPHWVSQSSEESQKNLQNPDWVKGNKDDVVKAILLQYFKKRIREYLKENAEVSHLVPVKKEDADLPDWCVKALNENKSVFRFDETKISTYLRENISVVRDYLYSMADRYVIATAGLAKKTEKISRIRLDFLKTNNEYSSFNMVLASANFWHEKLAQMGGRVYKDEAFFNKSLEGTEFIMDLPNNCSAYRLLTPQALDFESDYMGHCVGRGYYDEGVKEGSIKIYSIRDERGEPHVTFEVRDDGVYQCKGKQNKAPIQKYMPAVTTFIKKMNWNVKGDIDNTGLIEIAEKLYVFQDLLDRKVSIPEGTIHHGNIWLKDRKLSKLPDFSNLVVLGNFDCSFNYLTSLDGSPKEVDGDFICSYNNLVSLKGAPEFAMFFVCTHNKLTSLEGCSRVSDTFDCSNNELTNLKGISKSIKYSINCGENKLESLEGCPESLNGYFYCQDNKLETLKGGPKYVEKLFDCSFNNLKDLEGAPVEVGEHFTCSHNDLVSLKGAPKKVGGLFDCSHNKLTSLDGKPEVAQQGISAENNFIGVDADKQAINKILSDKNR